MKRVGKGFLFFVAVAAVVIIAASTAIRLASFSPTAGAGRLALIRVEGIMLDSRDILADLARYRDNPAIKGIVIRLDSPGGAVVPAQEIYQAIKTVREKGKPVVASLGTVAASGAYYVATAAERIVANPGTLTGSIGVIMKLANVEGLLKKVGVESVVIKSGAHKDLASPFRTMRPEERQILEEVLHDIHEQFIEAVAVGRGLEIEEVRRLADGRIFTGRQAKDLALVDELGTLQDAVRLAAGLAGIEGEPQLVERKERFSVLNLLRGELKASARSIGFPTEIISLRYLLSIGSGL